MINNFIKLSNINYSFKNLEKFFLNYLYTLEKEIIIFRINVLKN